MIAEKDMFDCAEAERFAELFTDGELAEDERAAMERHVATCLGCARLVRHQVAFKAGLKAALPRTAAPEALRARIDLSLSHERPEPLGWRKVAARVVPAAAAAALLIGFMVRSSQERVVFDAAVEAYRNDLPLDVRGPPHEVRAFLDPRMKFAVRPPQIPDAFLVGARLANLRERQAALLVYNVGGSRVSVFVFDPGNLTLDARHRRQVGRRELFVDGGRGYSVAMMRERGIGYAFTSDLDEDQLVRVVSSAMPR